MTTLHDHVQNYLRIRRALGYKLERSGTWLTQFADWLDETGADAAVTSGPGDWASHVGSAPGWPPSTRPPRYPRRGYSPPIGIDRLPIYGHHRTSSGSSGRREH